VHQIGFHYKEYQDARLAKENKKSEVHSLLYKSKRPLCLREGSVYFFGNSPINRFLSSMSVLEIGFTKLLVRSNHSQNCRIPSHVLSLSQNSLPAISKKENLLTLILLTTTIVAPPSNASKWQMGFNLAFKGLK
jgi:hypothetical protein